MQIENKKTYLDIINDGILWGKENVSDFEENEISDGYHTFNELYEFRKMYNAALFNEWAEKGKFNVHKSWKHHDGEDCFPQSKHKWFIVSAKLPGGLISNHYKADDWDLFRLPVSYKAQFPFDGHTGKDVLERIKGIL